MKKILVTGGAGVVGKVLHDQLGKVFDLRLVDVKALPAARVLLEDVRVASLVPCMQGVDVVIHSAWDNAETWQTGISEPGNKLMVENVLACALKAKVPKVILLSSIHADNFFTWTSKSKMTCDTIPEPMSDYGATKVWTETLGGMYARKFGLEVVCPRFGGINPKNLPTSEKEPDYAKWWLSHADCASMIRTVVERPLCPYRHSVFYTVSENTDRIHDWGNPFWWRPQDDSKFHLPQS